jgi:hypothetical protein
MVASPMMPASCELLCRAVVGSRSHSLIASGIERSQRTLGIYLTLEGHAK